MTEKGGDRMRGSNIGKYIPYNNFPSTGGRELKGGGYYCGLHEKKGQTQGSAPTMSIYNLRLTIYALVFTLTLVLSPPTLKLWRTGHQGRGSKRGNNNDLANNECCHPES